MNLSARLYKIAGDPFRMYNEKVKEEILKLPADVVALFTKRSPNQDARKGYLVHMVMMAQEKPYQAKYVEHELAFTSGLLRAEAKIRRLGFTLRLGNRDSAPITVCSVAGKLGVKLLRGSSGMHLNPFIYAPSIMDGGPVAQNVYNDYQGSPLFNTRVPETPEDVLAFLQTLRPLVVKTLDAIGEYIAEDSEE